MAPRSHAPLPTDDPLPPAAVPSADDLRGTLAGMITDLTQVARWLPAATAEEADRAALLLTALAAECVEAASMCKALAVQERAQ